MHGLRLHLSPDDVSTPIRYGSHHRTVVSVKGARIWWMRGSLRRAIRSEDALESPGRLPANLGAVLP